MGAFHKINGSKKYFYVFNVGLRKFDIEANKFCCIDELLR